jgi:WD40 repeat protein
VGGGMTRENRIKPCRLTLAAGLALCFSLFGLVDLASSQEEATPAESRARREALRYEMHLEGASTVAWSPNGTLLAIGDDTGVRLYTDELDFIELLPQESDLMQVVAWSPDGTYIAAVGVPEGIRPAKIYVWDVENRAILTIFDKQDDMVPSLSWSPDSSSIASASWDRTLQVWKIADGEIYQNFSVNTDRYTTEIFSVDWNPTGSQIAAIVGLALFIWDTEDGELELEVFDEARILEAIFSIVKWSPNGELLATRGLILGAATGQERIARNECPPSHVFDWHPSSNYLAVYREDGIYICDIGDDSIVTVLEAGEQPRDDEIVWSHLYALDWNPDQALGSS